jgi:5-methyltetrahydrofolate--homocysteine methyltransferase
MSDILERLSTSILEGDADTAVELVQKSLDEGLAAKTILDDGMITGMNEVGARFRRGDMFVPEVLMSADAMSEGLKLLRPELAKSDVKMLGTVVLGTVKGDLHDIGKNLVGMMCEGAGFQVVNLGFDVPPEAFIEAIKEHQPELVGMSALLTTTMRAMGQTIKAIEEAGLRDKVKIMVGGAPVDQDFSDRIGSDGYGSNAVAASDLAKQLVGD